MPYPYYNVYSNPYTNAYPIAYGGPAQPIQTMQQPNQVVQPQYMINVDGENSAKAWQPTTPPQPNTIIPLFDSDGQHVYFKTFDAYGRMNPIRKGRIVFDDEIQVNGETQDMSAFVTKEDMEKLKEELIGQINALNRNNQNGNNFRGDKR